MHPKRLCEQLWEAAAKKGCELRKGTVTGAARGADGALTGARLDDGGVVRADALLYACGPWSADAVLGVKYHSAVVRTDRVLRQCVFFSGCGDPEVYVRPDSTAYCTGFPEPATAVTEQPGEERVEAGRIATILDSVRDATAATSQTGALQLQGDPVVEQACYLPTTRDGVPIMGELSDNVYIAAGHSCWGILLGDSIFYWAGLCAAIQP